MGEQYEESNNQKKDVLGLAHSWRQVCVKHCFCLWVCVRRTLKRPPLAFVRELTEQ